MNRFHLVFLSLLCVACASVRQVTPQKNTCIEVRTETIVEKDTVFITML